MPGTGSQSDKPADTSAMVDTSANPEIPGTSTAQADPAEPDTSEKARTPAQHSAAELPDSLLADHSTLQAEMRRFSISSVMADQAPAANSTFQDSGR